MSGIRPIEEYDTKECPDVLIWDKDENNWVIGYFSNTFNNFNCITYIMEEMPDWFADLPPSPPTPKPE